MTGTTFGRRPLVTAALALLVGVGTVAPVAADRVPTGGGIIDDGSVPGTPHVDPGGGIIDDGSGPETPGVTPPVVTQPDDQDQDTGKKGKKGKKSKKGKKGGKGRRK